MRVLFLSLGLRADCGVQKKCSSSLRAHHSRTKKNFELKRASSLMTVLKEMMDLDSEQLWSKLSCLIVESCTAWTSPRYASLEQRMLARSSTGRPSKAMAGSQPVEPQPHAMAHVVLAQPQNSKA